MTQTRPFLIDGRKVILVDTPGFDDTEKSDADILKLIADFLSSSYVHISLKILGLSHHHSLTSVTAKDTNLLGCSSSIEYPIFEWEESPSRIFACSENYAVIKVYRMS